MKSGDGVAMVFFRHMRIWGKALATKGFFALFCVGLVGYASLNLFDLADTTQSIVRQEAVITSLIGAVLGVVLGVLFALLISRPLADEGFTLTFPIGTLILLLVLAAIFGVIAAIGPARRAARLDVLRALAYE